MIKIFLVEDEVVLRNAIKNSIHWEGKDMNLWGRQVMENWLIR